MTMPPLDIVLAKLRSAPIDRSLDSLASDVMIRVRDMRERRANRLTLTSFALVALMAGIAGGAVPSGAQPSEEAASLSLSSPRTPAALLAAGLKG